MLGKLSIRNAKRQAKDYVIYFITVIISVALMFSFNSIAVSKDIIELSTYMEHFSKAITGVSIIIIFVMAWLINYTMKFMLEKRSKEFGTYQILGIEKKDISKMFTLENLVIGVVAFVVGIFAGTFLYQVFSSIIMNLFNQPYDIQLTFNIKAVGITAAYFFGIFVLVLLNCRRKIKKTKVYDLLYADKKNENNIIKKSKGNIVVFIISLILLSVALLINHRAFTNADNAGRDIFTAIILLIVGIYLFYISFSCFIVKRFLKNKTRKYKKDNMFLYRNLTSKINTMSITMGTIALMFTIILIGGNVALLMNNMLNNEIEMGYPFEIMISANDSDFTKYKKYIEANTKVKSMHEYRLYCIKTAGLSKALENTPFESQSREKIEYVIGVNDYNRLREILGLERMDLKENEIIINCLKTAKNGFDEYTKENNNIKIANQNMVIKDVIDDNLGQVGFNGYIYAVIVPEKLIDAVNKEDQELRNAEKSPIFTFDFQNNFVVQTEETTDEKFYNDLYDIIPKEYKQVTREDLNGIYEYSSEIPQGSVQTRGARTSQAKSFYAIISFLAFYVALIFVMATATLLAIQQLSDSEKYKYRYDLLKKLGMDELEMNRTIFKQLFFYFAIPMLLPFIVSIPAILSVGEMFKIAVTTEEIWRNIGIIYGLFILVYGIYFVATDVQFSRNIEEGR